MSSLERWWTLYCALPQGKCTLACGKIVKVTKTSVIWQLGMVESDKIDILAVFADFGIFGAIGGRCRRGLA